MVRSKSAKQKSATGSQVASMTLRVRLTPREHEDLASDAEHFDEGVSEYVRRAIRAYREVFALSARIEADASKRALSPLECDLYLIANPINYFALGGSALTLRPEERPAKE